MATTTDQVTVTTVTIARTDVGWSTARVNVDEIRQYIWTAPHHTKTRSFARMDNQWYAECWKCGFAGNIGYGPDNGVCYECLGHGVRDYWTDGEEFDTKLRNLARNVLAESTKQRRSLEKRQAEIAAWRAANTDLIAWAEGITPTGKEKVDSYANFGPTAEEASATVRPDTDRVTSVEELEDGTYRALIAVEHDVFAGYSAAVQDALRSVRFGTDLDRRSTGLLHKVMADEATRPELPDTRHAGAPGERLAITGEVVMIRQYDDADYLQVKVEGRGADQGLTFFTNTSSASAYELTEGDLVTVKATIKRNEEHRGIKSDRVGRAAFTKADALPATPALTEAPSAPVAAPAAPVEAPAPTAPASEPKAPQSDAKPARKTGRREALGASSVDGWELLYDKPKAGAEVVRQDGRYALVCKAHRTLHHLDRLSDEGKVRKAGGWCTEC
ncbi:hypothetical protein [Streptomyces longwoodensis]|uniref:hypothetical protein n=1 Tax=Streptomyces longwoodensis TaxID=68231 RepID=UPI0036FB2971